MLPTFHKIVSQVLPALAIVSLMVNTSIAQDVVLNFPENHTLKTVFDAGLRPYRRANLETLQLRAETVRVSVLLPDGFSIPQSDWEDLDFNVISDGRLSTLALRTGSLTIEKARSIFLPILKAQRLSTEKMDAFLNQVKSDPLFFEGEYHVGTGNRSNPSRLAAFRRTGQKEAPLAVEVILDWQFEPKSARRAFYTDPIPPPPGYENVSMEMPPFQAAIKSDSTTQSSGSAIVTPQPTRPPSTVRTVAAKESPAPSFPIVPVAIIVLVIVGVIVFLLRRKSP